MTPASLEADFQEASQNELVIYMYYTVFWSQNAVGTYYHLFEKQYLIVSLLEVIQWQGLDPGSLWGTAPLPNPPPFMLLCCLAVTGDLWRISSSSSTSSSL